MWFRETASLLGFIGIGGLFLLLIRHLLVRSKKDKKVLSNIDTFLHGIGNETPNERPPIKEHQIPNQKWNHLEITKFMNRRVEPYKAMLMEIRAYEPVCKLIEILDQQGGCSSIAQRFECGKTGNDTTDQEAAEWKTNQRTAYEILSENVSLREHTLNVADILIENRKKESKDFQMEMGRLLLVALGHDIGKIPEMARPFTHKDHFMISHDIMSEILPMDYPSREEILKAVRDHHLPAPSSGNLLSSLKAADHKARQLELKQYGYSAVTTDSSPMAGNPHQRKIAYVPQKPRYEPVDLAWLDLPVLLQRIGDRINVVENGKYEAFSHAGIVYVYPRLIAQYACDLAVQSGRMEIMAHMANEEKMACLEYALRQALNEYIPDKLIGPGYIGGKFQVIMQDGTRLNPGFYLPLKIMAFSTFDSAEIEKRKQTSSILQSIRQVSICKKGI